MQGGIMNNLQVKNYRNTGKPENNIFPHLTKHIVSQTPLYLLKWTK